MGSFRTYEPWGAVDGAVLSADGERFLNELVSRTSADTTAVE